MIYTRVYVPTIIIIIIIEVHLDFRLSNIHLVHDYIRN